VWNLKLTYVAHAIEIALIAFLCIYVFILQPSQPKYFHPPTTNASESLNKPPELSATICSTQDLFDDLESLGCQLVNASAGESKVASALGLNYSDFRLIAYNTKMVFVVWQRNLPIYILIIYHGLPITCSLGGFTSSSSVSSSEAFTRYEKLEFASCYATKDPNGNFTIHLTLKNTGSAAATLDMFFFNAVPHTDLTGNVTIRDNLVGWTINPGDIVSGTISLKGGKLFKSGISLELMVQTVAGKQYPKVVVLP
jgi:hypothetical protein